MQKTILAVDDDLDQCDLLAAAADAAGCSCSLQVVSESRAALDYLEGRGRYGDRARFPFPDLILLDLHMPGMSGLELLEYIRAHWGSRYVRVVMLTTSDERHDIERAREIGADAYLAKPADFDELIEIMRSLDRVARQPGGVTNFLRDLLSYRQAIVAVM